MNVLLTGINHKTAPIAIREKFYLNELQQEVLLSELKSDPAIVEAFVLSTCNRTEICVQSIDGTTAAEKLVQRITCIKDIAYNSGLMGYFYEYRNEEAILHLLRVSSGLDSLVLGEKQILGQVKKSFELARVKGVLGKTFNLLSQVVVRAGKKARSETDIGYGGSSISWAAIVLAEKVMGALINKTVLMIGAGKMSELAVGHVSSKGFKKLFLMNRTPQNAQALAKKYNGVPVPFCDIKEILSEVDLCICSSSAPHYVLSPEAVERAMRLRGRRPLTLIDISMPRNIDPGVSKLADVRLYHLDELEAVVQENMQIRQKAIAQVEKIIAEKLAEFKAKRLKQFKRGFEHAYQEGST